MTMRVYYILPALLSIAVFAGCKPKTDSIFDDESRLKYSPQVNEVEVVTLVRQDFPMQLLSNGKLCAARRSALYFAEGCVVSKINAVSGTYVREGSVIAEIDSREQSEALESARLDLDKAHLDLLDFIAGLGYSTSDISSVPDDVLAMAGIRSGYSMAKANYKKAERALQATVLRAPFSGKVADLKLKMWDRTGSDPFCAIIDDSSFEVTFTALESEYGFLQQGQNVRVTPFSDGAAVIYGKISSVNPTIDKYGQVAVTATVPSSKGVVDGMNVKVIVDRTIKDQLVVPKSAVVIRDNLEVLFRYNKGKADWVYVNTLMANSDSYVIEANKDRSAEIHEGDLIIVKGNLNLADGSKVELKNK